MLCTRCQQREAHDFPPEKRARFEAAIGTPWPLPEGLCGKCMKDWFKSPEGKESFKKFDQAMHERWVKEVEEFGEAVRSTALKVLDLVDELAGKR
jgi:hypothetical protein